MKKLKQWAHAFNRDLIALYLAARHPRTPRSVRLLVFAFLVLFISPIDLISPFIPILGDFGDLILLPLGFVLARRWVPSEVLAECRQKAESRAEPWRRLELFLALGVVAFWVGYSVWQWKSGHLGEPARDH